MSKVKVVAAAFIAALALTALASATASADWMVNGTNLTGSAALATTAHTDVTGKLNGGGLNIECSGDLKGASPEIKVGAKGSASSLTFTTCGTTNANCTVPAEISTVPVSVLAELDPGNALATTVLFTPTAGTIFATVKFSGEKCAVAGIKPVTGKATALAPTGKDERTEQELEINTTEAAKELFIASSAASLTGAALLLLSTRQGWSFL